MAPDWFLEAYIATTRPKGPIRPELYRAADEAAATKLWLELNKVAYLQKRFTDYTETAAHRFPWVEDDNTNTLHIREARWANRAVLYSPEEQADILSRFPEVQ